MSGSITSSENSPNRASGSLGPWYLPVFRAALEGALIVVALGGAASWLAADWALPGVRRGLALAWLAGTLGTLVLAWGQSESPKWFMRAYGIGAAVRGALLVAIVIAGRHEPWQRVGAVCGAYAVGLTAVMLLEFRHLVQSRGARCDLKP